MTLDKMLLLFQPQFPPLQIGADGIYLQGLWRGLNGKTNVAHSPIPGTESEL